jgi:trehalose-phosphatase
MIRSAAQLPSALADEGLRLRLATGPIAVCCDYDGTLTPIVARPELARLPDETLAILERLARCCVVAIISGRDLDDLRTMVPAHDLWLAGSHGFDVAAPGGIRHEVPEGRAHSTALVAAAEQLEGLVASIPGAWVERKRFAVAVHFRQVDDERIPEIEGAVDRLVAGTTGLRKTGGKRIFELRPDVEWDKGRALWWLVERAGLGDAGARPVYLGDDETDEDAFVAVAGRGLGIVVERADRPTHAEYRLADPDEVRTFLGDVADLLEARA